MVIGFVVITACSVADPDPVFAFPVREKMFKGGSSRADQPGQKAYLEAFDYRSFLGLDIALVFKQGAFRQVPLQLAFGVKIALLFFVDVSLSDPIVEFEGAVCLP